MSIPAEDPAVEVIKAAEAYTQGWNAERLVDVQIMPDHVLAEVRALSENRRKSISYRRFPSDAARKLPDERTTVFKMENEVDELLRNTMKRGMQEYQ